MTTARGEVVAPSPYRSMYYTWERDRWAAAEIDLRADRARWHTDTSPEVPTALVTALSLLHVTAEQLTNALVPFVDAAPTEEQQVFLTTQLADEARHTVFLDRVFAEVVGESLDMRARLDAHEGGLEENAHILLFEVLPRAAERVYDAPADLGRLVEGMVLCHLLIRGTVSAAGERSVLDHLRAEGSFPGLEKGFDAMARDHARHVAFGVAFLAEVVAREARYVDVIDRALRAYMPAALAVVPDESRSFALDALGSSLQVVGVELPD